MIEARPLEGYYLFDPEWPLETHQYANEEDDLFVVPVTWTPDVYGGERGVWRCVLSDSQIAAKVKAVREVLKLPLTGTYRAVAELTAHDLELAIRWRRRQNRERRAVDLNDWTPAQFRQEVESVAGEGTRRGRGWWHRCPFHEDRNPSLEVDYEHRIWKCWAGCGQGGHKAWRMETQKRLSKGML